jgi:glycosyltransferase involved in cell wall biosynthesis
MVHEATTAFETSWPQEVALSPQRTAIGYRHASGSRITDPIWPACELSIVMPCLNEAETLESCIRKALAFLEKHAIDGEVVIADNGSKDGSQALAARCGARVVNVPAKGYGSALLGGIRAARGRYIIMGDADDSYDFVNLMPFVEKLREGYELVMGNRFRGGIKPKAMPPLHKYVGNPVLTFIGKLFFKSSCSDFHCGLRGFSKAGAMEIDLRTTGMEFASEMVVKMTLHKKRIAEVPTTLSRDGRSRPPHLRSWHDGWRHLRFLLLYSPRWLFLYPGLVAVFFGLLTWAFLLPGPQLIKKGIQLDVHTLLYGALALTLGYQSIIFAVFTKVFAISEGLLPADPRLDKHLSEISLEKGLICGGIALLLGIAGSIFAVVNWETKGFGLLNPSETLRVVIPSVTVIALGFQTMLSSLFLSVLQLKRR